LKSRLTLETIIAVVVIAILFGSNIATSINVTQSVEAATGTVKFRDAPVAISGSNVYVTWWTNNTANDNEEVMFRASTDGGQTFGEKINLSNTTNTESVDAMIDAEDSNVVITWWERNGTSDEPVARISTNAGETFGPILQLSQNETLENSGE
jgi:hypothetical protein